MTVRPARADDARALYEICLRTGHLGGDATGRHRDPRLLGEVYVGPYLAFEPRLAFVVVDDDDVPGGYVLGARDTRDLERRCEEGWWPPLRRRYPREVWPPGDPDGDLVDLVHHPRVADPAVVAAYPSHLHVDLLPARQGGGWGRALLETLFDALASTGSPGLHLGVALANEHAIGFYRRMGFVELRREHGGLTMGRSLA